MLRNKLVRSNGSVIDSSVIISCEFTEEVNSSNNLAFGDVTSSELTVEVRSTEPIQQGEVFAYYMVEDGVETLIGKFIAEKPTVASRSSVRFSAYDNISKTEKLFSGWLRDNQELFPMTAMELLTQVCAYSDVAYAGGDFPNQSITINSFHADNMTCRQVLSWIASLAGRFVRANSSGQLELAQYSENVASVTITPDASTDNAIPYMQGTLSYETYTTDTIHRVQIKHSEDDIGVVYPAEADGNCYTISQNMLLGTCSLEDVISVAQTLYEQLKDITYVPFTVTLPRTLKVRAGEIIRILDINGNSFVSMIMKMGVTPGGVTISSTGDKSYDSNVAVSSEKYGNLTGKVLELSKSVDGMRITNKDLEGKLSSLEMTTEAFKTTVQDTYVTNDDFGKYQETVSTALEQTANSFEFQFNETREAIEGVEQAVQDERNERVSYIRLEDGNIILGNSDSDIMLIVKNDRISFVRNEEGNPELAYFANDVLHVTEAEFTVQMVVGKFGYQPGPNGNLSFRKVVT